MELFKNLFENYLKTISKLNISIIELGYLSDAKDNNGLFYHLNKGILLKAKSLIRKDQKIFAMINFKEIKSVNQLDKLLTDKKNFGRCKICYSTIKNKKPKCYDK